MSAATNIPSKRENESRIRNGIPKLPDSGWFHIFFLYKTVLSVENIVRKLTQNLDAHGYKCGTPETDFLPGRTIIDNVYSCLQKSLALVILLSEEFLASKWCKYDIDVAQTLKNNGQKLHIIPLVLGNCKIPDVIGHVTYLEIDEPIEKWHGRFLQSVIESVNVGCEITRSSSISSICQNCRRSINVSVSYRQSIQTSCTCSPNQSNDEELQFQLDEECEKQQMPKLSVRTLKETREDLQKMAREALQQKLFHPDFVLLQSRLATFKQPECRNMPCNREMALAGFFYTAEEQSEQNEVACSKLVSIPDIGKEIDIDNAENEDKVQCFQCGKCLKNWSVDDNPTFEHARWSPKCPYIIAKEGQDYVNKVSEAVREAETEGNLREGQETGYFKQNRIADAADSSYDSDASSCVESFE